MREISNIICLIKRIVIVLSGRQDSLMQWLASSLIKLLSPYLHKCYKEIAILVN